MVEATEIIDFIYKLSLIYFPEYQIIQYKDKNFIISNIFRGTIANNLVKGFPCTNAENFRKFIAEFWGRAGQLSILEKHWEELLPLTSGIMDWKVARDLTFIALASYPKSNMVEKQILEISDSNSE